LNSHKNLHSSTDEEEIDDGVPLWKKALMKKRMAEEQKKEKEMAKKVANMHVSVHYSLHLCTISWRRRKRGGTMCLLGKELYWKREKHRGLLQ